LDDIEGDLHQLFRTSNEAKILVGQFEGRTDITFPVPTHRSVFTYVLEGAFEVQNCLLEKGDGLTIQRLDTLEFEALSNDAILLVICNFVI
jgi:redox-sensitive bicupin YhaK (pirin superfamily)